MRPNGTSHFKSSLNSSAIVDSLGHPNWVCGVGLDLDLSSLAAPNCRDDRGTGLVAPPEEMPGSPPRGDWCTPSASHATGSEYGVNLASSLNSPMELLFPNHLWENENPPPTSRADYSPLGSMASGTRGESSPQVLPTERSSPRAAHTSNRLALY